MHLIDVQYDCFSAPLEFSGVQESWWNDRNGVQRYFWAGADDNNNSHTCQCGIDKNCVDPNQKCNCDAMTIVQLNDNGIYIHKRTASTFIDFIYRLRDGQGLIASYSFEFWANFPGIEWQTHVGQIPMFWQEDTVIDADQLPRPLHRWKSNQWILCNQKQFHTNQHRLLRFQQRLQCCRIRNNNWFQRPKNKSWSLFLRAKEHDVFNQ